MYEKREKKSLQRRIEKFVQLGEEKYGKGTYDYSLAKKEYSTNRIPVHLICNSCKDKKGKDYTFPVYPSAHTYHGDNDKGTCPVCYEQKLNVQETRWNKNIQERIDEFVSMVNKKYQGSLHLPHVKDEYKEESSRITVICKKCKSKPFTRLARSLKAKDRIGGCEVCNKKENQKKTNDTLRERQLRNHATKDKPRDYGCIYKITNTKNNVIIQYPTSQGYKVYPSRHCLILPEQIDYSF
jgi:Zn finger protein HypA/HybF involved in hydrogenase expression